MEHQPQLTPNLNQPLHEFIDQLHADTTQSQWTWTGGDAVWKSPEVNDTCMIADTNDELTPNEASIANAKFIAAIHQLWPQISSLIKQLQSCHHENQNVIPINNSSTLNTHSR